MDIGPEYRAAIGVPGGFGSELMDVVNASQAGVGFGGSLQWAGADRRAARDGWWFELKAGQGDDPDTLGKALVWVYDTATYPFIQAEVYHQFHDDFLPGGNYPQSYNAHVTTLLEDGRIVHTGCPRDQAAYSHASAVILAFSFLAVTAMHI
eukprot:g11483.t1